MVSWEDLVSTEFFVEFVTVSAVGAFWVVTAVVRRMVSRAANTLLGRSVVD